MRCFVIAAAASLLIVGCDADKNRPNNKPAVEVNKTPDLDPRTDDDVDVKLPDVDVDVNKTPDGMPDIDVDVMQPADADTRANETERPGVDEPSPSDSLEPAADGGLEQPQLQDVEVDSAVQPPSGS